MKTCPRCKRHLPLGSFYHQKDRKDGHAVYCKQCRKEQKQEYLSNPIRKSKYQETNQKRRRDRLNSDLEYRRRVYAQTDYRSRNTKYTSDALDYLGVILKDTCVYCGSQEVTVDHIDPVSKGGSSDWDNLAPACLSCNASKHDKGLLNFLLTRRSDLN